MKKPKIRTKAKPTGWQPGKAPLERMLKIHDLLNAAFHGSRRRVNYRTLAAELGMKSSKTIQRDFEYMRDRLGLKIEYDHAEKTFSYTEEHPHFPLGHDLTFDERVALVVGRQSLDVFLGVDLGKQLKVAFDKITGGMLGEGSALLHEELSRFISVRTPGAGRIEDPRVFIGVRKALLGQFEMRIDYQGRDDKEPASLRLHPYHLACVTNRWVLVALNVEKNLVRTYILARCKNPVVTQKRFERPADFSPQNYLSSAFDVWAGTGTKLVRLRINAKGAHHVLERAWHDTQCNTMMLGGSVEVTFKLGDLNDITRWILSFGADCEVLEPKELRNVIAQEGRRIAQENG